MSALLDYMRLCRLCLVKDKVNVPIFGEASDVRQIFLKITACLPVKVSQDDNLPKSICDSCLYKVDLLYQFWNTTVNAEKQLIQWLAEIGVDVNIKNTSPPNLRMLPQSHAHPHSMHESIILKEERPDPDMKVMEQSGQNYQGDSQQMYSGYEMPYQPQINMTVGAPTDFTQPTDAPAEEEVKVPQQKAQPTKPTPAKRRGRPPKQKTPPAVKLSPPVVAAPAASSTTTTGSKRRSSAAAAAAAVAAAAANASSDESDPDDRFGGDDSDDEDMDVRIAKEEADSEDEEYVDNPESLEPTTFVGIPSTSTCDSEQPGPSGLGGGTTTGKTSSALPASAANESGSEEVSVTVDLEYIKILREADNSTSVLDQNNKKTKVYSCAWCPEIYEKHSQFINHKKTHVKEKCFPCPICSKVYKTKYILAAHMKAHTIKSLKCDICHKDFSSKTCFDSHIRKYPAEDAISCNKCNEKFHDEHQSMFHNIRDHDKMFSCFVCKEFFTSSQTLLTHVDTYHEVENRGNFKCEFCGKSFINSMYMKDHMKKQHLHIRCKVCEICGKSLSSTTSLNDHMLVHTNEKPLRCEICGKIFRKRSGLTIHIRTHTGDRPYPCPYCEKRFTQSCSLTIHLRRHNGDRPFECEICNNTFITQHLLNLHRNKKHKKFNNE